MRTKLLTFYILPLFVLIFIQVLAGTVNAMTDTIIYRANLQKNKNQVVVVKKRGGELIILLEGFSNKTIELKADSGGTGGCRTIIEHNSGDSNVLLSLAIPAPNARCSMSRSFISIQLNNISLDEEPVKKTAGADASIRNTVQKILGALNQEG